MEAPHEECKVLGLARHYELFWASSSVLRMSVILETLPSPPLTQEFRKAPLATQPPGFCLSAAVPTWKFLTSCSTGASCGSSSAAADRTRATLQKVAAIVGETPEPYGDLFWGRREGGWW